MENHEIVNLLCKLAQLDIDAVSAYDQALKHIDNPKIFADVDKFRNDHVRHIDILEPLIQFYGGTPPERTKDFKGYLIEGFTSLRSITGLQGALKAMDTNEMLTNKIYRDAIDDNPTLPADVLLVIQANYMDERAHLIYIRDALKLLETV